MTGCLKRQFSIFVFYIKAALLGILFLILKALHQTPVIGTLGEGLFTYLTNTQNANMKKRNYWHTLFGWEMYKSTLQTLKQDGAKTARLGLKAPNPTLVDITNNNHQFSKLLDLQVFSRPVVVLFGSCTWPPFMASLQTLGSLVKEFAEEADFVIVYIEEAHPDDGWKFEVRTIHYFYNITTWEKLCKAARGPVMRN